MQPRRKFAPRLTRMFVLGCGLRRMQCAGLLALSAGIALAGVAAQAQTPAKIVQGKVFDAQETALSGAVVYLQNEKTNEVKTFISTPDGSYRFGQLSADTDFKLWARYKDVKSKTLLISSFDPKLTVTHDFHIGK